MKKSVLCLAAVAALASLPALADDPFVAAQGANHYLARDHLIGAKVTGKDGKIIADVEDLIIDDNNQVVGVVMGTGGYFGIAEKKVGVTLSALKFEEKDGHMTVALPDVDQAALDAAPAYARTKPPKSLFERAQEKVHELSDKTEASTKDAYEKAKPAIEDATTKAKDAYEKAKEAAAPALEKAKEAAGEAYEAAKEAAKSAAEEATKAVEGETPPAETPPAETPPPAAETPPPAAETPPAAQPETPAQP